MLFEAVTKQANPVIEDEGFWKKHIALLNESKMTRKKYCARYDVNYDRFGYWLGRLRDKNDLVAVKLKPTEENPVHSVWLLSGLDYKKHQQLPEIYAKNFY